MIPDIPLLMNVFADWCINLSAGWFGAAIIVPVKERHVPINWPVAIANTVIALALFFLAFILKREFGL